MTKHLTPAQGAAILAIDAQHGVFVSEVGAAAATIAALERAGLVEVTRLVDPVEREWLHDADTLALTAEGRARKPEAIYIAAFHGGLAKYSLGLYAEPDPMVLRVLKEYQGTASKTAPGLREALGICESLLGPGPRVPLTATERKLQLQRAFRLVALAVRQDLRPKGWRAAGMDYAIRTTSRAIREIAWQRGIDAATGRRFSMTTRRAARIVAKHIESFPGERERLLRIVDAGDLDSLARRILLGDDDDPQPTPPKQIEWTVTFARYAPAATVRKTFGVALAVVSELEKMTADGWVCTSVEVS